MGHREWLAFPHVGMKWVSLPGVPISFLHVCGASSNLNLIFCWHTFFFFICLLHPLIFLFFFFFSSLSALQLLWALFLPPFWSFPDGNWSYLHGFPPLHGWGVRGKEFAYCLEVGGDGRKLTWQGVPRSIRVHHHIVRDSYDGLIVPRSLALYFSGGDGKELRLRVTGRIWKELWKRYIE